MTAIVACDITQEHIDTASERLAEATVASGSYPTTAQHAAGRALVQADLAGSSWRMVDRPGWPHAEAVMTLGSNGRVVWHVAEPRLLNWHHWRVQSAALEFSERGSTWSGRAAGGLRIDANTVCFTHNDDTCGFVLQRVTP